MLPTVLGRGEVTSSEERVFDALARCSLSGTALHSLNLPAHDYKLTAELDFVLVLDDLIMAIEVKGGRVACEGGTWTYSDRHGRYIQSREGPFKQVQSGMYALRDQLRAHLAAADTEDLAFGYLVVTPDTNLPTSAEWAEETYCGHGGFGRGIEKAVARASEYWLSRQPYARPLDGRQRSAIVNLLRPDFDRSPLLDARADALDRAMLRLTDEQYSRLDVISESARILVSGGAGTGKTFLAAETARRDAEAGRRVLFACRSGILADYVGGMLAGTAVTVRPADQLTIEDRYDTLVVDEAQDLMTYDNLDKLDRNVVGGLAEGRWVMLMDQNRQAHLYGDFDPDALQHIRSLGPVLATLRTNCRNTREIAFHTRALTGADTGVSAAGAGPQIEALTVADPEEETAQLDAYLRRLRDEDVPEKDITLVSLRGDWETSAAARLKQARKGRLRRLDDTWARSWPGSEMSWASAIQIKGLENRFVCVIDIDTLETDLDIDLLYVALSRPRAGLWIAMSPAVAERANQLFAAHAPAAMAALTSRSAS